MKPDYSGLFVVIEGIDGVGKTTLAKALEQELEKLNLPCLLTFEPTRGKWGKKLRQSFTASKRLSPQEELALFQKDRKEHLERVILPALSQGKIVICDRYYYSTAAYQGARGIDPYKILTQSQQAFPEPDLCLWLCLDPQAAVERIVKGRKDEINNFEELNYLKKVSTIYDKIMNNSNIVRLDARLPLDTLVRQAVEAIQAKLKAKA